MRSMQVFAVAALVLLAPCGALAAAGDDSSFYQQSREGWYFYEGPPKDKKDKRREPQTADKPKHEPKQQKQAKSREPQGPRPMSAKWIKKRLNKLRQKATTNPTPTNVKAYLYLQKAAMDKASRFSETAQKAVVGDPYLDAKANAPTATYAVNAAKRAAGDREAKLLKRLSQKQDIGLVFVFDSNCRYCRIQAPVLKRFAQATGLPIRAISLDGGHLPGKPFPQASYNPSLRQRLNIQVTPTTFLARPPDGLTAIGHGALSMNTLRDRTILVAQREGWISRKAYERASPVDKVNPATEVEPAPRSRELENPQQIINYIQANAQEAP